MQEPPIIPQLSMGICGPATGWFMHAFAQSPIEDTTIFEIFRQGFTGPVLSSYVGVQEAKSHDVAQQAGPNV